MGLDHIGQIDGDGSESVVEELGNDHSVKLFPIFVARSHVFVFVFDGRLRGGGIVVGAGGVGVGHARAIAAAADVAVAVVVVVDRMSSARDFYD